jgi:hypothetical protein
MLVRQLRELDAAIVEHAEPGSQSVVWTTSGAFLPAWSGNQEASHDSRPLLDGDFVLTEAQV